MTNSLEDYLETIYLLAQTNGSARVRDVAQALHVKMPSVIKAVLELKKRGYVTQEPYGAVDLTEAGTHAASEILGRHTLKEFLDAARSLTKQRRRMPARWSIFSAPRP